MGGSRGREGCASPHRGPNSFNFMQFLEKFAKIVCSPLPPESWRPHLGEILGPQLRPNDNAWRTFLIKADWFASPESQ